MWARIKRFFSRKATPLPSPPPSPPPPTMLDLPWRRTEEWDSQLKLTLCKEIMEFKPSLVNRPKIILLGPVGSGKSSLVNTLSSLVQGYVTTSRSHAGTDEESKTKNYKEYKIEPLNFLLCDTKGIEGEFGVGAEEFTYILDGNMLSGYEFKVDETLRLRPKHKDFRTSPKLDDKAHCVCFVFDSTTISFASDTMITRFKTFVKQMDQKDIPHMVLLTKVDKLDKEVKHDLTKVYRSIKIQHVVDKVSEFLGIPRNLIMPVKNYESEVMLDDNIDILALLSFRQMIRAIKDFLLNSET